MYLVNIGWQWGRGIGPGRADPKQSISFSDMNMWPVQDEMCDSVLKG